MAALPYMPLYVADYLADAAHLSTLEHGAYLLLIMTYWQRGEALPDDDKKLARIVRVSPPEWAEMRETLSEFFDCENGLWRHGRIERELNSVREKSERARNAGRASAERRSNDRSTPVEQSVNHTDTDTDTDTDKNRELKLPREPDENISHETIDEALQAWNEAADQFSLSRAQRLTAPRKTAMINRLRELGGLEGWRAMIEILGKSPHLLGENDRGWRATFDWILKPANLTKVMESNYVRAPKLSNWDKAHLALVEQDRREGIRREGSEDDVFPLSQYKPGRA